MKDGEASFETEGGSLKTGENFDWPKDSMASLPKPDAQIVSIAEMQEEDATAIILIFNDKDGGSDYMKKLSDIGYVQRSITKSEGSVMYMEAKDDNTSVMLSYEPTEGNGSITLSRNDESTKEFFESKMDNVDEEPIEINMEESMDWPKDAMDNIPVIKAQITSVAQDNERVSIGFKGINEKDMTSYIDEIKSLGYDLKVTEMVMDDFLAYTASNYKEDLISINWTSNEGTITYTKQ